MLPRTLQFNLLLFARHLPARHSSLDATTVGNVSMNSTGNNRPLIIPGLGGLYTALGEVSETILRVVAGAALVVHGSGKIINPMGSVGMVESLGFYPGIFWSPLLAATEFFGGILLVIGLLTRPAAFATMIVLAVTIYFHGFVQGQGWSGSEKSILWTAILFFFVIRGASNHSVDARLGREF
jgi:putative oxidoreductase